MISCKELTTYYLPLTTNNMQDHPIPQAVTSYEFHLIGNMTLKQFLELAAGIVVGVIMYQTNLYSVVKWPIIVFCAGLGAMIAFVPYEGRPLDQWFFALFRAIYKPTQFYWRKSGELPDFLKYTKKETEAYQQDVDLSPYRQQRIFEYIHTLPSEAPLDPLDFHEQQQMNAVLSLFDTVQVERVEAVEQVLKPNLTMTTHSLQHFEDIFNKPNTPVQQERLAPSQIPESIPPIVEETQAPVEQVAVEEAPVIIDVFSAQTPLTSTQQDVQNSAQAIQTSTALPFPQKPTKPNLVVGMVFDQYGNIVENGIVEIQDAEGMPVRAVRTNKIGQFYINTPLKDGEYYMKVEKEGILFPTQKLILNNTILDPVEIHAMS